MSDKPERFSEFLALLLQLEGGEVDDRCDKGGHTNLGVTQDTYDLYRIKAKESLQNVKEITRDEVGDIYFENYYERVSFAESEFAHYLLFDLAVNSGPERVKYCVQEVDNPNNPDDILKWRRKWYRQIVKQRPENERFLKGWLNRLQLIEKHFEADNG